MTPPRSRLEDVAARAGVAPSTASRALNHPTMVRSTTRARVETAARELGYTPNGAARGLSTGHTRSVAVVVPDLTNPYFALLGREAETEARSRGYDTLIVDTATDPAFEHEVVDTMSRWVDGIIVCAAQRTHVAAARRTPIVYVNRRVRGAHAVLLDQAFVVDTQLGHLADLGHTRVCWVSGPKVYWASAVRRRRAQRWSTRLDLHIPAAGDADTESGVRVAAELPPDITAVAAFNDAQAFGVLHGLLERGVRIPDDISVVGSDDVPTAQYVRPRLTTVRAPKEAMGRTAVSLLLDHLTEEGGPVIVETLTGELVVRDSTAPPPGA